jgi:hypothetical protein
MASAQAVGTRLQRDPLEAQSAEPLTFGSICVVSGVCGCAGFVGRVTGEQETPNVIVADYCGLSDPANWTEELKRQGYSMYRNYTPINLYAKMAYSKNLKQIEVRIYNKRLRMVCGWSI